jgi:hypothetical protein
MLQAKSNSRITYKITKCQVGYVIKATIAKIALPSVMFVFYWLIDLGKFPQM